PALEGGRLADVLEDPPLAGPGELGVLAGDGRVADHHVVVGRAPDPDRRPRWERVGLAVTAEMNLAGRDGEAVLWRRPWAGRVSPAARTARRGAGAAVAGRAAGRRAAAGRAAARASRAAG